MLAGLSPARRRFVLAVAGLVSVAVVVGAFAWWASRSPAVHPASQGTPGPVLLVPGYGGSTTALEVLADALRAQGREAVVVHLAGDGFGDLDAQALVLERAAILETQRTGARSVDVVGYSAGGVIARLWVRDHGGGALARRIVTLGSPHHGTDLAGLAGDLGPDACPVACRQLEPDSDLLRRLNAGDESPAGPLWVSIWSTDDQVVVPPSSADLQGALDFSIQSVCPDAVVAHGDLPRAPVMIAAVIRELGVERPVVPGPEICQSATG
jgi:triacylglycerol esterase/lipase EstA (alpha/beta hydrolase family)